MPVALENHTVAFGIAVTSLTSPSFIIDAYAHGNVAAFLAFEFSVPGVSNITTLVGGVAGSLITNCDVIDQSGSVRIVAHQVKSPATGSQTASFSWTTASDGGFGCAILTGVDQTKLFSNGASNTGPFGAGATLTITSTPGDRTMSARVDTANLAITNQTQVWGNQGNLGETSGSSAADIGQGQGTTTHTWTGGNFVAMVGANANQAGVPIAWVRR